MSTSLSWVEKCPLPLAVLDRNGVVLFWSTGAEQLTGWSWERAVGRRRVTELIEGRRPGIALLRRLRQHGRLDDCAIRVRTPSGESRPVRFSLGPLTSPDGTVDSYLAFAQPLPLDASPNAPRRAGVAAGEGAGLLIEDPTGRISYADRRVAELLGCSLRELVGARTRDHLDAPELVQDAAVPFSCEARSGKVWEHERLLRVSARPQLSGTRSHGRLLVVEDLGDADGGDLPASSVAAAERLVTQGLVHDLAHFLTLARTQAELLATESPPVADNGGPSRARVVADVLSDAAELVQRLRSPSVISPSDKGLGVVEALRSLEAHLRALLPDAFELSVRLPPGESLRVAVDPAEFRRVVINLVLNAREACPTGGRIALSAFPCTHANGDPAVRMTIEDDGVGMNSELLAAAFEPHCSASAHGSGLGLFVVQRLVEAWRGQVSIESAVGRGTRVTITVPRASGSPPKTRQRRAAHTASVLVVEDDPVMRETLRESLAHFGHRSHLAVNGADALAALGKSGESFDLALIDARLPDIDGRELAHRLEERQEGLISVLCTGESPSPHDPRRVLRKPFSILALETLVAEALDEQTRRSGVAPVEGRTLHA